jgi:SPFH domain / Band 7 family
MKSNNLVLFAAISLSIGLGGCSGNDITTKGDIMLSWNKYTLSPPTDRSVVLTTSGEGTGQVEIVSGKYEYDPFRQVAFHINGSRQNAIFTSRTDQGSNIDDAIDFSAQGSPGKANLSIFLQFQDTQASMGQYVKQYRLDDADFIKGEFRQTVQRLLVEIMREYDPVTAAEKPEEIAKKLKTKLQENYGKLIIILDVGFTDRFVFSKEVDASIARAANAKAETKAAEAEKTALDAKQGLRTAQRNAFTQIDPAQREFDLKKLAIEKGLNPFQPTVAPITTK